MFIKNVERQLWFQLVTNMPRKLDQEDKQMRRWLQRIGGLWHTGWQSIGTIANVQTRQRGSKLGCKTCITDWFKPLNALLTITTGSNSNLLPYTDFVTYHQLKTTFTWCQIFEILFHNSFYRVIKFNVVLSFIIRVFIHEQIQN